MGTCFENMDRKIPFDDTPRKQVICKKCGKTYFPPLSFKTTPCPYCRN
jgi:hypothetical protein